MPCLRDMEVKRRKDAFNALKSEKIARARVLHFSGTKVMRGNVKFVLVMLLLTPLSVALNVARADCAAASTISSLPQTIGRGQCFEYQGSEALSGRLTVQGRLTIKAGARFEVSKGSTLMVSKGGTVTSRGIVSVNSGAALTVDSLGTFESFGELHLREDSQTNLGRSANLKSSGKFVLYPNATVLLSDNSLLLTQSSTTVDNAVISSKGGKVENRGTLNLTAGARVMISKNGSLSNSGRLGLNEGSAIAMSGNSMLSNRRNILVNGSFTFGDTASFQNYGIFDVNPTGTMQWNDGASFNNLHALTLSGTMRFKEHSVLENHNGFKIKEGGVLEITDQATAINRGSVYNSGTLMTSDQGRFDNKKFYFDANAQETSGSAAPWQTAR